MADGTIRIDTKIDPSGMEAGLVLAKTKVGKAAEALQGLMSTSIPVIGGVTAAFVALGNAAVGEASKVEDFIAAFTPLTGSASNAKTMIEALNKVAAATPFTLTDIANTAKQLLPVLGNDVNAVTSTFKMLGDTAGGNAQKLDSIARGYVKVMNTGKVSMEALNMISDAGVPIQKQLANSMGITVEEMYALSASGKISAAELTKTFQTMTSEGGLFFNGMEVASKTLSGKISTMNDNIAMAAAYIGKSLVPVTKDLVDIIGGAALGFVEFDKQLKIAEWHAMNLLGHLSGVQKTVLEVNDDLYAQKVTWDAMNARGEAMLAAEKKKAEAAAAAKVLAGELAAKEAERVALNETLRQQTIATVGHYMSLVDVNRNLVAIEAAQVNQRVIDEAALLAGRIAGIVATGQAQAASDAQEALGRQVIQGYQNQSLANQEQASALEAQYQASLATTAQTLQVIQDSLAAAAGHFASLSASAQKFGDEELAKILATLSDVAKESENMAKGIGKLVTSGFTDVGAWIQVAVAGVALLADAWDTFWGNQTKKEREADERRRKRKKAIEKEATDRLESLKDELLSERELLQKSWDDEIARAKKNGADKLAINQYYQEMMNRLATKEAEDQAAIAAEAAQKVRDEWIKIGDSISGTMSDALKKGDTREAFRASILEMLQGMAVDAVMLAVGFKDKFEEIGKTIKEALVDGFSGQELDTIDAMIGALYDQASAAVDPIKALFAARSGAPAAPSSSLSDANLVVPSVAPLAAVSTSVGSAAGLGSAVAGGVSGQNIVINFKPTTVQVDGRVIGQIAFEYLDEMQALHG